MADNLTQNNFTVNFSYSGLREKGYLAYEYNPFHNYQTDVDLCELDGFLIPSGLAINTKNGELLIKNYGKWIDKRGIKVSENIEEYSDTKLYAKAGSLIDLDTDKLNFDLNHPVDITVQPSYDGSVNLILNDDKNIPRLINSRFSVREKNTYEIVDRIGENDTNIYNSKTFDKDTALYFQYEKNPIVKYYGFVNGRLQVGQYCFYFTYCDADDNESDYIAETGVIPVFIGSDKDPNSIDGGIKNLTTNKGIRLLLSYIDKSYNYLKIYYVRYFADYLLNRVHEAKKIIKRYPITSDYMFIQITGYEEAEDIDANILNISRFNPKSVLTLAQCKNMLFFGNIVKNTDNYKELTDCALRIIPEITPSIKISPLDYEYSMSDTGYSYYDSINMYNSVGYFNNEYYRFGIVFIYLNGTLSNVYNVLGGELSEDSKLAINIPFYKSSTNEESTNEDEESTNEESILERLYIPITEEGWINSANGNYVNARGVCKFNFKSEEKDTVLGINFNIPKEVINFLLNKLGIRGLFFVRLKCVPTILAQCYLLPMDEVLEAPVLELDNKYYTECFVDLGNKGKIKMPFTNNEIDVVTGGGTIKNDYESRLYEYKYNDTNSEYAISKKAYAAICPDFLLNLPYYNQIFNGSKFKLKKITSKLKLNKKNRFYYAEPIDTYSNDGQESNVIINTVTEEVPTIAIKDKVYRLEMGETEEAFRFRYAEVDNGIYNAGDEDFDIINSATNIVRGKYSPYLAIYSNSTLDTSTYYNIYPDLGISINQEFKNRMYSSEPFYAISNRYNFDGLALKNTSTYSLSCWKGDCYINTFTYRLNRNFNDPSLPNNDEIIDKNTWKDHYKANDPTEWTNISRADLNAVQMGSWITINVRSAMNYALRSEDHSYVSEEALMGAPRSFYPRCQLMWRGENKMPDSYLYNDAYRASLGYKCYFALQDINYIKDTFSNRILYSAISILDSFKNNFRFSLSTYFRDYSQEYGSIQKLIGFEGYLLVVFEHAICIAVINERILAGQGDGNPVFINTQNVLPEELTIISDTYGTQWPESVIKSESGAVYGVDTVAKKIWRVKGLLLEILSDFKVNKFLVDNISLDERETFPIIGLKNVKTHYNNNKKDILFTFYDDIYRDEEKAWNLCYNELLDLFITFYSWIPSYSENIDTLFFTFDRNTSKLLALLNKCSYSIPENYGVLLDSPISDSDGSTLYYKPSINDNIIENISWELENDHWGNYNLVTLDGNKITLKDNIPPKTLKDQKGVLLLYVTPKLTSLNDLSTIMSNIVVDTLFKTEVIAITKKEWIENTKEVKYTKEEQDNDTTGKIKEGDIKIPAQDSYIKEDFYLHGQSGIIDIKETIFPCKWYGENHPFEFEFVINDKIGQLKIFSDLVIISNKAEPESFHFEIEGDNYEFSSDKRAMYFRQEATKNLYLNLGSNILYDRKFTDVMADDYTYELYYRGNGISPYKDKNGNDVTNNYSSYKTNSRFNWDRAYPIENKGLVLQVKSTIFPLYYNRVDTYNELYDKYENMVGAGYDFKNLSGSEIKWNRDSNLFNIVTHIKNSPIDLVGRLRGNSRYKEGKWNVLIPSISFMLKNEEKWPEIPANNKILEYGSPLLKGNTIPPIIINSNLVPNDLNNTLIEKDTLPNIYQGKYIRKTVDVENWTYRKETKIRDKWMKVRVRYSGRNLAVIHSIITLYNISYS